jgi:Ca-activated chloride channel family protein
MSTAVSFAPVEAKAGVPIRLAMQRLWLTGRILPAGARLTVQHVFRSEEAKPLEVIYSFPLPRDAVLRAFRIKGDGFEVQSKLKETEDAVKVYEQGVADGSLATLARQYGDGVVNLTVGNIRPNETVTVLLDVLAGVELRDDGFRFRFPFTLAPAYHSQMKAAVVDGEGEIELPAAEFGDMILPRFREDASSLHEVGFDVEVLHEIPIDEIGSPSHGIRVKQNGAGGARVALGAGKDVPNRDLVLDVRFKEAGAQVLAGPSVEGKRSFAAIVPSTIFGANPETPRRIVIVLDRSGSMDGAPITQARKAIEACLGALAEADSFGLVAFDDRVETLDGSMLTGSRANRERARKFLDQVDARGGTELAKGFTEAARILNGAGDLLILTDGQVAGTENILAQARAANIRIHCLGIMSASQDRFLSLLARETGGVSRSVTANERDDLAAVDLFASVGRPIASGLKCTANVQPEPPAAVFAGTPVLLFGELPVDFSDSVELTWDGGGRLSLQMPAGDEATGQTMWLLQGSRLITDWETRYPSEEAVAPLDKRKQSRVAARLLELSRTYSLASREMSLVAVVKRAGDRPGELPETRVVPVGMPQDTRFGAYFGATSTGTFAVPSMPMQVMPSLPYAPPPASPMPVPIMSASVATPAQESSGLFTRFVKALHRTQPLPKAALPVESDEDKLVELAAQLEPDGGMPSGDRSERAARTVAAVFAFVSAGHTLGSGAFRTHLARLVGFLKSIGGVPDREREWIDKAIAAASSGTAPEGDWLSIARSGGATWRQIEKSVRV